jgi:polyhydroxybutyrate depolymerase
MHHPFAVPNLLAVAFGFACLCSCGVEQTVEIGDEDLDRGGTLESGGITRSYEIHLPPNYMTTSPPVVILFHRADGDGFDMRLLSSFDLESNYYGFLAVYPYAVTDWAYGCDCTSAEADGIDDVQFVLDLLDTLEADYSINRDSVFVTGFAEGALMAQKMICDAAESFAGLATVGATMSVPVAEVCEPSREMPVLMIHGKQDEEFRWDGAPNLGALSLLSADTTLQFWATHNGCGDRVASEYVGFDSYYNFEVYREGFESCPAGADVVLYRMEGAGHGWPNGGFIASDEIANFFSGN